MTDVTELRVALTVQDFGQALALYRDTLGLEQIADWSTETGRVVVLDAGRATLELLDDAQAETVDAIEAGRRVSGTVRLALEVADSADMARRLVAAGAVQVAPPVMTPWGDRNARVQAPDGMQLTLFTPEELPGPDESGAMARSAPASDHERRREEHHHDGHRLGIRCAGHRSLRRHQRTQPLFRDARRRAAADLAARRARVGGDIRADPSRAS